MANRLANAMSPYLQQHAGNPVDWWEWGPEAFAEAKRRDTPILLSVGYAACHWCHVMAHESFENPQIAQVMNQWFVNIKVDREERPDVDAAYIRATTMMTGHAGWPMTVFAAPDGRPFYCGTYYRPQVFAQLLAAVHDSWTNRRADLDASVTQISEVMGRVVQQTPGAIDTAAAVRKLATEEDRLHGGFGGAPKFPPSMVLEFLLRHGAANAETAELATGLAERTLKAMAFSGMYDQLAGGFARYSVDAGWQVPHFEKMLYDNALLASDYLHQWRLTGNPTGRRIALETCDFMVQRLAVQPGGLGSALDADTNGVEGLTYVWTPEQLAEVLGEQAQWVQELTGVTEAGNFEHGTCTLRLLRDPYEDPDQEQRWQEARAQLLTRRDTRPQPAMDDKVVLAWNALAITALARTGALCDRPDLVETATATADFLIATHLRDDGSWARVSRGGTAGEAPAVVEDLANFAQACLSLAEVTLDPTWLEWASALVKELSNQPDPDQRLAGWGDTVDDTDNAYPSDGSAAAMALLSWATASGATEQLNQARQRIAGTASLANSAPRFAGWWLASAEALHDGPAEIALVGADVGSPLHRVAMESARPGRVVIPDQQRPAVSGQPSAYVCRENVCQAPVTTPTALQEQLGPQGPPSQSQ